jgi:uncharacterized protein
MTRTPTVPPDAQQLIDKLGLAPHPEGGYFRETFRDPATDATGRARSTAIYFLLVAGQVSRWHTVDAVEIWHWHAGSPLELGLAEPGAAPTHIMLGFEPGRDLVPQAVVPAGWWQQARSTGAWTLVGCTVAPGFEFKGFVLAPDGCDPPLT